MIPFICSCGSKLCEASSTNYGGLCPSRNLLTPYLQTSYNSSKRARPSRGRKDARHEKIDFLFSDIRACVCAPYRLRLIAQAAASPHARGDRCPHGDAGTGRNTRASPGADTGTGDRTVCRGDPGRRYSHGWHRLLYGDPARRQRRRNLLPQLLRREHAAHCVRNAHRRAVTLVG